MENVFTVHYYYAPTVYDLIYTMVLNKQIKYK